jgi:hypothetical protein
MHLRFALSRQRGPGPSPHACCRSCEESLYERGATDSGVIVFAGWDVFREFALDRCCGSGGRRVRSELGEADPLL